MKDQLKLSIIIPVYNMEQYLQRCFDSVLNQKYPYMEIIVVDDGSTDNSLLVCTEYAKKDNRIHVIHKENQGLVAARKTGLDVATGQYITYVDADDWIDNDAFEKLMKYVSAYNPDIIISPFIKEIDGKQILRENYLKVGHYTKESLRQQVGDGLSQSFYCGAFNVALCTKIVRRELLCKYQNAVSDEIVMGEDTAVSLPMVFGADSIYVTSEAYYHYVQNKSSMSWKKSSGAYGRWCRLSNYLLRYMRDDEVINAYYVDTLFYEMMTILHDVPRDYFSKGITFFNEVQRNNRIIVYGKGVFASNLIWIMEQYNLCIVKMNIDSEDIDKLDCLNPDEYDYVVIGILDYNVVGVIKELLRDKGVYEKKILTVNKDSFTKEELLKML